MTLRPSDLVGGKYRIVRLIGDGGMGSVYEARHELLGVAVALKFLHSELSKRPGLAARFLQEARVSATIQSVHVARVTDVDTATDGSPYLVMELLSGESLQALLDRQHKLAPDVAIDFSLQTLAGLESAHALGVVHRDLKPDNVFVTPTSSGPLLKLIDFGIAKLKESSEYKKGLTRAGVMMGTPEYMAPEQLYAASEVDHRADIYSLGVMLFEMLSGQRPADGDAAEEIIAKVLAGNVKQLSALEPTLPAGLSLLVGRALSPEREQRFATAYELRRALTPFARELSAAGRLAALAPQVVGGDARSLTARGGTSFGAQPTDTALQAALPPSTPDVPATVDAPPAGALPKTLPPEQLNAGFARGGTQAAAPQVALPYATNLPASPVRSASRRKRRRGWPWLVMALVGIAIAAGLVVARTQTTRLRIPDLPSWDAGALSPEATRIEPIEIPSPTSGPWSATPQTPTPATPRNPAGPRRPIPASDAGTSSPLPFPSFALPSSLPSLPSGFPPFPTALPTALPSFLPQIPGLTFPSAAPPPDAGR